jgi:hypothetical protein
MREKIAIDSPKECNRLPGVLIAGKSITNSNNSTNIRKNSKSFLDVPIGTRRSCLQKKTGDEKSRDTVRLRIQAIRTNDKQVFLQI